LDRDKAKAISDFNAKLNDNLSDENFHIEGDGNYESLYMQDIDDERDENPGVVRDPGLDPTDNPVNVPTNEEYGDMLIDERPEADDEEAVDKYLNAELILDVGTNNERRGRVVKRARGLDGEPLGRAHANPLFDTREYDIEFTDGTTEKYQANLIAENMFAQVDDEGNQYLLLGEISDHKKDNTAVSMSEGTTRSANGNQVPKVTTRGWKLLVQWKDGSSSWEHLKDLKESNPIEVAEYAVANRIAEEPAFKWWVSNVLRRRNRIISKAKSRYWRTTHKFGIRLPHSVEEALNIDRITGTDFWRKAINKEMSKVKIAWKLHEGHTPEQVRQGLAEDLIGFQEIGCHLVFDVKMDFTEGSLLCWWSYNRGTSFGNVFKCCIS
jgi:hypothetical protein